MLRSILFLPKLIVASSLIIVGCKQTPTVKNEPQVFVKKENLQAQLAQTSVIKKMGVIDLNILAEQAVMEGIRTENFSMIEKGQELARHSLQKVKNNHNALLILAKAAEANHEFEEAIRIAEEIHKKSPQNSKAQIVLINSYLAKGDLSRANKMADLALTQTPRLLPLTMKAVILTEQGRNDEAEFFFKTGFKVEDHGQRTTSSWARSVYARNLLEQGEPAEAIIKKALELDNSNALAMSQMAQAEIQNNNLQKARHWIKTAYQTSGDPAYAMGLAQVETLLGHETRATEIYDNTLKVIEAELASGHGHRLELTQNLLQRPIPQNIAKAYEAAIKEQSFRQSSRVNYWVAVAALASGRTTKAQESVEQLLQTGVKRAEVYYLASLFHQTQHHYNLAQFYRSLATKTNSKFKANHYRELVNLESQLLTKAVAQR